MNIDVAKSYATEENLVKALKKHRLEDMMPLIVRNREGRFTAVFGLHNSGLAQNGNVTYAARHGFLTID